MIGRNTLTLNEATMQIAVQEYLAKRWPDATPTVVSVKAAANANNYGGIPSTFAVEVEVEKGEATS